MSVRLGLLPWERDRLSPEELREMWEGYKWRRSRDMEVFSSCLVWLRTLMADTDYDKVVASMPGYDGEHERLAMAREQENPTTRIELPE